MQALLDAGAEPLSRCAFQQTPLHLAAQHGNVGAVKVLLDTEPAALDSADIFAVTPLSIAAGKGESEAVRLLLAAGASRRPRTIADDHKGAGWDKVYGLMAGKPNEDYVAVTGSPIAFAAFKGHEEVLRLLLLLPPRQSRGGKSAGAATAAAAERADNGLSNETPAEIRRTTKARDGGGRRYMIAAIV